MKRIGLMGILLLAITGLFMLSTNICLAGAPKEIRIGVTAPLTGPAAEAGVALKQGMIMAVEEWNAKGGIQVKEAGKKLPVKILIEDCQSKPEIGVSVGEKLITRDKVHMLLGDAFHSSVTMAVMELAPKYGLPVMSVEPVSVEIAKKIANNPKRYWSFWKGDWNSTAYANTIFSTYKYLIDNNLLKPRNKTVAFIVEDTDYGRSNAENASELFKGIGWETLAIETVALGYTDFYPQLTKFKSLDPDILVTVFTPLSSGVAYAKQFHEVGMKCSHFAIYYPLRPEFIEQAGKAGESLLWSPLIVDPINNPEHKAFGDKIKKRWKVTLTNDHGSGYDGVNNALDAIQRAGSLDPKAIVEALSKLDNKGVLGRYVFDQKTHTIKDGEDFLPVPAAQIKDGKSKVIWPASMATSKYHAPAWLK
ncbi:MAG: ABC transporter substrate-binding protein [Deltaproteobacteria bacterium]|nr:ABC transporter substrate-binding protein [Deltaproteobacteria bacterium]MBW1962871.1 ABC transporter substrate-binding protein [Deltaproteobacteria bacterium]MBW1995000.1 ABC transporter substrate-binding protein [Deltaproteobacteria bacterium]MBW2153839.1 ABC transporter substrate-binding protein [Deltaproteobacteria bacterium]